MSGYIILMLLVMTLCGSLGGYFLKLASNNIVSIMSLLLNKFVYIGGSFYVTGAVLNIIILKHIPYNIVLPLNSVTYIWTLLFSAALLKEKIKSNKIIGVALIILGVIFIAK